jgi:hypothetical protein
MHNFTMNNNALAKVGYRTLIKWGAFSLPFVIGIGLFLSAGSRNTQTYTIPPLLPGVTEVFSQLSKKADLVVVARVTRSETIEDHGNFYTYTDLQVDRVLKGNSPTKVVVRSRGGTVGDILEIFSGEPAFHLGEWVLMFLSDRGQFYEVSDQALGKYTISADAISGQQVVTIDRNVHQIDFIAPPDGEFLNAVDRGVPLRPLIDSLFTGADR